MLLHHPSSAASVMEIADLRCYMGLQWRKKQFTVLHHVVRDIQLSMTDDQEEGGDGPEAMQVL